MSSKHWILALISLPALLGQPTLAEAPLFETGTVIKSDGGEYAYNAIPGLAPTPGGKLISVWSARQAGPQRDPRIVGAMSNDGGRTWSKPFTLVDHKDRVDADPTLVIDGSRIVVLSLALPLPQDISVTEIWMTASEDEGKTWSKPVQVSKPFRYTEGMVHPGHKLADGRLAMGIAWDLFCERGFRPRTEGEMNIAAGLMFSSDGGLHWTAGGKIYGLPEKITPHSVNGVDEPATVILDNNEVFALLRTGASRLWESRSRDFGATWSDPVPSPLVAHNSPAALWRLRGTNEVVVIYNHSPLYRHPLVAGMSEDGCHSWSKPRLIVDTGGEQVSYPNVAQAADGTIVAVWQQDLPGRQGRDIRWARFNVPWLMQE